jgi:anti-sigma factor RsiW
MDCTRARSLLHGYIDRELDLESVIAVDEHLKSCDGCKQVYGRYATLGSAIRQHGSYYTAPPALAARIRAQVGGRAAPAAAKSVKPRSRWYLLDQWLRFGTAIAATAAVTWVVGIQLNSPSKDDAISEQVIAGYARSGLTNHLIDVASSDQHTVKPWLSGKLDYSPLVTDLTTAGFPLVGGRLDYLDNRPVAALVYRHRQHVINLFVWPYSKSGKPAAMQTLSKRGYNLLHWADAGMTYWVISDVDSADLKTFADAYASAR